MPDTERTRVLLTRPLTQAKRTAGKLRALGYAPVSAPMLEIVPVNPDAIPDFGTAQAVLITSGNGAAALARLTPLRDIPILTVGDQTAQKARIAGFSAVRSACGDGAALTEFARKTLVPKAGPVIHVRGRDASVTFDSLRPEGFTIQNIIGYEARKIITLSSEALNSASVAALIYSARTAEAFSAALKTVPPGWAKPLIISISAAAAAPLSGIRAGIRIAPSPDEDALLDTLLKECPPAADKHR